MKLTISGEVREYKDGTTLLEVVEAEKVETPEYVTASVNDELSDYSKFDGIVLKDGDVIEFLYFMGGGRI